MIAPLLPLLLACAPQDADAARLSLRAVYRRGDPLALAVAPDESRAWVVEGTRVALLDLSEGTLDEELASVGLDVPPVDLDAGTDDLLVAGGEVGLWRLAFADGALTARRVERREGALATAVARTADEVLALWQGEAARLATYDRATLAPRRDVELPEGEPVALAVDGATAWVALGTGGLARVDLGADEPRAEPGPAVLGSAGATRYVRDVAIADGVVYAACDEMGVARIGPDVPRGAPWAVTPARLGAGVYAVRVAARGGTVVVGTSRGPARAADGAPYGFLGTIGWDLSVGGVPRSSYERGEEDLLVVLDDVDGTLRERARHVLRPSGWRSLALGDGRTYEQHHLIGAVVRALDGAEQRTVARRRPFGHPCIDGVTSAVDPDLILFGVDPQGAVPRGLLRLDADGEVRPVESLDGLRLPILHYGARWVDAARGCEWFVGGYGFCWYLLRVVHEAGKDPKVTWWRLQPPEDADGERGHTYLRSALVGDRLLLTRAHTRFGLVLCSAAAVTALAVESPPGLLLELPDALQVETHAAGLPGPPRTWGAAPVEASDGRTLVALAAGCDGEGRARALVLALGDEPGAAPRRVAELSLGRARGQALAVAAARVGGRAVALVADVGGALALLELEGADGPRIADLWRGPRNPYGGPDGTPEPVLDVEVTSAGDVLAAGGHRGLLRFAVVPGHVPRLELRERVDTPGWAAGVHVQELGDETRVLVGDQRAGLRVYDLAPAQKRK